MVYAYFVSHPSELRHDVRDNFEEFVTGITEQRGDIDDKPDDRPIAEQAAGMMDQLAAMEAMMSTNTFGAVVAKKVAEKDSAEEEPEPEDGEPPQEWVRQQTTPTYPTVHIE